MQQTFLLTLLSEATDLIPTVCIEHKYIGAIVSPPIL